MKELSANNFGLVIAYLLPGATMLWGLSHVSPALNRLLIQWSVQQPTIGGFLYATLFALGTGLFVSTIRWLVIDQIHYATGVTRPQWDFSMFHQKVVAYDALGEVHYRYYQFYSGMVASLVCSYVCRALAGYWLNGIYDIAVITVIAVFAAGSRDTFTKYNRRMTMILGEEDATAGSDSNKTNEA